MPDKFDITERWDEPCRGCGKLVRMTTARFEALGTYHDGCFGYPACACSTKHEGDCAKLTIATPLGST